MSRMIVLEDVAGWCDKIGCHEECEYCICIDSDHGFLLACLADNRLWIPIVVSKRSGGMKEVVCRAVRYTGINRVVFTTVLSPELIKKLAKKRQNVKRVWKEDGVLNIEVEWVC